MEIIKQIAQVVNVLSAVTLIVLVLLQHGKGADIGASFGSGAAGSLFGASGSANFLSRVTAVCATLFFCTLFVLVRVDTPTDHNAGVMSKTPVTESSSKGLPSGDQTTIPN